MDHFLLKLNKRLLPVSCFLCLIVFTLQIKTEQFPDMRIIINDQNRRHIKPPHTVLHRKAALCQKRAAFPFCPRYSFEPRTSSITRATLSAYVSQSSFVGASTMTRTSGSVPDGRTRTRPSPPSSVSTASISSLMRGLLMALSLSLTRTFCSTCG